MTRQTIGDRSYDVIYENVGVGRRDSCYQLIILEKGKKLKVDIRVDSYDFQSHAIVYLFKEDEWKLLHTIHYSQMLLNLISNKEKRPQVFHRQACELLKVVLEIV